MKPTAPFRLGEWLVEPATNRLLRPGGELVRLEPKVMEVLLRLAGDPGEVVSRDELLDAVWPGQYVTEHVIFRCVSDLRKCFGDDPAAPRFIETIRKRGYRLVAPVGAAEAEPCARPAVAKAAPAPTARRRLAPWVAAAALAALAAAAWLKAAAVAPSPPPLPLPLTSFPGSELDPALSPDGSRVAFAWNGSDGADLDLYVLAIGSARPRRLTVHPAEDKNPAWSPDGRRVAFVRAAGRDSGLYVVDAAGRNERRLASLGSGDVPDLAWSPDGRFLYFAGRDGSGPSRIVRLDLASGRRRAMTSPAARLFGDRDLALSPDGRRLAFARAVVPGVEDLWVSTGDGSARRLTTDSTSINGLEWAADGSSILFSSVRGGSSRLWRIEPDRGELEALPWLGEAAMDPTSAAGRMAFERRRYDTNLWRLELSARAAAPRPLVRSTRWDAAPALSPDGRRIAFVSDRTGPAEIWIADAEGEIEGRLRVGHPVLSPVGWSPDGGELVFALQDGAHSHLYRAALDSRRRVRLTSGAANDAAPSFSRDGRWIYFGSDREGGWQIWKMPASGGVARRVTRGGGTWARESADGRTLFVRRADRAGLWSLPAAGGAPEHRLVAPRLPPAASWAVGETALYFTAPASGSPQSASILRYDLASGEVAPVSPPLPGLGVGGLGLAVAPDESFLVFGRVDGDEGDLVLVEEAW